MKLVLRSTRVPIAERLSPMMRSPSQWPGTARSSASAGRSLIMTSGVTSFFPRPRVRALSGLGHRLSELGRLARDRDAPEHLALGIHPLVRRAAPVQVDSDVLSFHRGLPCRGLV